MWVETSERFEESVLFEVAVEGLEVLLRTERVGSDDRDPVLGFASLLADTFHAPDALVAIEAMRRHWVDVELNRLLEEATERFENPAVQALVVFLVEDVSQGAYA